MYPSSQQQLSLPVADELWLLSHSETSGRPRLAEDHIALGLAGAVLCELLISRSLVLSEHAAHVVVNNQPTQDEVGNWVLRQVLSSRASAPVKLWVQHLADEVEPWVTARLDRHGAVVWEKAGLFGRGRRAVPRSINIAAASRVRLTHQMTTAQWELNTATVGALTVAIDLDALIAADIAQDREAVREPLITVGRRLPAELKAVLNGVRTSITEVTMSIQR